MKNVKDRMDFILFRVGGGSRVERKKNVGRDAWKLASLRLIKKMRGTRVRKQGGDYPRTHALMASFNKNYRADNFTRAAV